MSGGGAIGSEELPPPPHEDNKIELNHLNNGHLSIIESNYGHYAGAGKSLRDLEFINKELFRHFI